MNRKLFLKITQIVVVSIVAFSMLGSSLLYLI
mgnify:CR=1 FL=1